MIRFSLRPNQQQIEALLAAERVIVPEAGGLRERVMQRVHATMPKDPTLLPLGHSPRFRRLKIRELAVAAVLLSSFCAAAFYAGYHASNEPVAAPVAVSAAALPSIALTIPATSASCPPRLEIAPVEPTATKAKSPTKLGRHTEAFVKELRVLQPAREAVTRQEFALALGAIAEHQRQYPAGALTEEREALRVKALLGLGRIAEAQRAGAAFHTRFPRSALLGRIDEMLGRTK